MRWNSFNMWANFLWRAGCFVADAKWWRGGRHGMGIFSSQSGEFLICFSIYICYCYVYLIHPLNEQTSQRCLLQIIDSQGELLGINWSSLYRLHLISWSISKINDCIADKVNLLNIYTMSMSMLTMIFRYISSLASSNQYIYIGFYSHFASQLVVYRKFHS